MGLERVETKRGSFRPETDSAWAETGGALRERLARTNGKSAKKRGKWLRARPDLACEMNMTLQTDWNCLISTA